MAESLKTRLNRLVFNFFPAYRGTGGRITYIAADWHEIHVKVPLNLGTRNYVGTIFGGSMYGAIDPIYMIMLIRILGPNYIVWDKAACIYFKKPGRSTLRAHFKLTPDEIGVIQAQLENELSIDRVYAVDLVDSDGVVCATCEKTIYIRRKQTGGIDD